MSNWSLIESDPAVFTELISRIGVRGVEVNELFSLDDLLTMNSSERGTIYGLIFLFKWRSESKPRTIDWNPPQNLFFARQVITNACATQAILSILMNIPNEDLDLEFNPNANPSPDLNPTSTTSTMSDVPPYRGKIQLGSTVSMLKEFTRDFDPEMKGMTLGEAEVIRQAHNSIARPDTFEIIPGEPSDDEDSSAYHFIAYIPFEDRLYELDGLQPGPILLEQGGITKENWLQKIVPYIQERIQSYASTEINFNLMAVCNDRLETLKLSRDNVLQQLQLQQESGSTDSSIASELQTLSSSLELEIARETEKRQRWEKENIRRRHNYLPFLIALLKEIAAKGELEGMIKNAVEKKR